MTIVINLGNGNDDLPMPINLVGDNDHKINGNGGSDTLRGGPGNDTIYGGNMAVPYGDAAWDGMDIIYGGTGQDWLYGGSGGDTLFGEQENDNLFGGLGDDSLDGGSGNDLLEGGSASDRLFGGEGNDWLIGANFASPGNAGKWTIDTLIGGAGSDVFFLGTSGGTTFYNNVSFVTAEDDPQTPLAQAMDYALITDFNPNEDLIRMAKGSSASDYFVKTGNYIGDMVYHPQDDTLIYRINSGITTSGNTFQIKELIAVVQDTVVSLNADYFVYGSLANA